MVNYEGTDEIFANPERGFSLTRSPLKEGAAKLKADCAAQAISLVRCLWVLSDFRDKEISSEFLKGIASDFAVARQAGIKLVIRFAYNWGPIGSEDASLERILGHLDQVKPLLQANQDVIAYMQAGFIGTWGEWHHSTHGLDNTDSRRTVLMKILSVLPATRMVGLRYPYQKREIFDSSQPLTAAEAFNGSPRARTGAHNDCLVAAANDWGTYLPDVPLEVQKNYLNQDNQFVVQGGETCHWDPEYAVYTKALRELARMHWSELNREYEPNVLGNWREMGGIPEVQRRLGYRFRLLSCEMPDQAQAGGELPLSLSLSNDGWASPYNPRLMEIVLRQKQSRREFHLPVKQDPRRWLSGEQQDLKLELALPKQMPAGKYEVFLNFPDPSPSLYGRPEYSIRLANAALWEPQSGYNRLLQELSISAPST